MATPIQSDDPLLGEAGAAVVLGGDEPLSIKTLQAWRSTGRGPRFVKLGPGTRSPVRYRLSDLRRWLVDCERQSTAEHSQRAAA
jgi:hypothetical protein